MEVLMVSAVAMIWLLLGMVNILILKMLDSNTVARDQGGSVWIVPDDYLTASFICIVFAPFASIVTIIALTKWNSAKQ